jgi:glycosyltransferase involved in cell wall biosynthesis
LPENTDGPEQDVAGSRHNRKPELDLVSIVVPAYNEAAVIGEFSRRLSLVRKALAVPSEVIFVNDGSMDGTLGLLKSIRAADPTIAIVDLSRNFGKEIALTACIDHSGGDVVIVIDADLQDPPELIPKLIKRWYDQEVDVIYGQRASRAGESFVKRFTSYAFYRAINSLGADYIPLDAGDFRLLSRRAVEALRACEPFVGETVPVEGAGDAGAGLRSNASMG